MNSLKTFVLFWWIQPKWHRNGCSPLSKNALLNFRYCHTFFQPMWGYRGHTLSHCTGWILLPLPASAHTAVSTADGREGGDRWGETHHLFLDTTHCPPVFSFIMQSYRSEVKRQSQSKVSLGRFESGESVAWKCFVMTHQIPTKRFCGQNGYRVDSLNHLLLLGWALVMISIVSFSMSHNKHTMKDQ